jgi:hypothetical protein
MTSTYHHVLLVMHRFKIPLILAAAVMLAFSAFTARKLLLRGPGRVGIGCGAETGCEGV